MTAPMTPPTRPMQQRFDEHRHDDGAGAEAQRAQGRDLPRAGGNSRVHRVESREDCTQAHQYRDGRTDVLTSVCSVRDCSS